jgi:hypothetical protein
LAERGGQPRSRSTSARPLRKQQTSSSSLENSGPAASSACRTRWRAATTASVKVALQFDVVRGISWARVTDLRTNASHRYSPAAVVAVNYDVVSGVPAEISTSYVERSNLSLRMSCSRFTRLTNGFSKKLENHAAAVSLYVAHYNFCREHEALRSTPAIALGITDHVWSIGELVDAAIATQPITPVTTAPDRRKRFQVIEDGKG